MKIVSCRKCKLLLKKKDAIKKPIVIEFVSSNNEDDFGELYGERKLMTLYYCPSCGKSERLKDRDKIDFIRIRYDVEDGLELDKTLDEIL